MKTKSKFVIGNNAMLTVIFGPMLLLAFSGLKDFIVAVSIAFIALLVIAVLIFLWQIYLLLEKSSLGWSFNMISGLYTLLVGLAILTFANFFIGFVVFP
ncbi:hypothetical protein ACGIJG_11555 [Lacticaseibacillus rhamnosus]|uniref:hypothetical protein n=1 Tax=Lacticaseibacillus rhamnosus TaxID=47715 RepID=UPI0022E195B7|nr:hypothetical protein [Lacticaseibacillus rhamnosus]